VDGHASISSDVLASYSADAALEVPGVARLVEGHLPRQRGVRVTGEDGAVRMALQLEVEWGASIPDVGREVQARVREYLARMTDVRLEGVDVTVESIEAPG
jgi:uncharacterized alkaline shock family protein YloU